MSDDFLEQFWFSPDWTHEETCLALELVNNGDFIDWDYWAKLSNITPEQAAKLYWAIDPIKCSDNHYALGDCPEDLLEKIKRIEQWLKNRFSSLSLSNLIDAVGKDKAPTGMIEAVERQRIDEAKKHSFDILQLEQLTEDERSNYNKRAAWSWVEAIYILQGYKPVFQLNTEQVRSHFPEQVAFFAQSIQLGNVGKELIKAGQRTFIESPTNWKAFWQTINHIEQESQADAVGNSDNPEHRNTSYIWQNDASLTKLEKQRKAILEIIKSKGFDAMAIPDGEKGTIETLCRADYHLLFDAESSFTNAWKGARHLFRMANHASFAKRGKQ